MTLTLPWRLRYLCGYDNALCRDALTAFIRELMRSLRHRATGRELATTNKVAPRRRGSTRRMQPIFEGCGDR